MCGVRCVVAVKDVLGSGVPSHPVHKISHFHGIIPDDVHVV